MGMTLMVKRDYIENSWVCVNIYIYIYIDNGLLVVVEFKFLKLRW